MLPWRALLRALLVCAATAAEAHRTTPADPKADGLPIPSLTHGQMAVIADNLSAIRALADAQFPTDPTMRRLQGYVNLQSFACLWGLAPRSLTDEESPFNECAHAYLAGARALLLHLKEMPGDRRPVDALVGKIEIEMLANHAALTLCRYSDEPFNTGEILWPHWREIPRHAPTALAGGAVLLALASAATALARLAAATRPVAPLPPRAPL
jgi:hypothetical protein